MRDGWRHAGGNDRRVLLHMIDESWNGLAMKDKREILVGLSCIDVIMQPILKGDQFSQESDFVNVCIG